MDEPAKAERWPALRKDDAGLKKELETSLSARATGDPYGSDGAFAQNLKRLPTGLRAMAATHWLDISLTLDSITWHFGNFGEPGLVAETEAGLIELGLDELAWCFHEAKELMIPLISERTESETSYDVLERKGLLQFADELNRKAWALRDTPSGKSAIYEAWIRYARQHPEHVFDVG
jgi:hypothetical protein